SRGYERTLSWDVKVYVGSSTTAISPYCVSISNRTVASNLFSDVGRFGTSPAVLYRRRVAAVLPVFAHLRDPAFRINYFFHPSPLTIASISLTPTPTPSSFAIACPISAARATTPGCSTKEIAWASV